MSEPKKEQTKEEKKAVELSDAELKIITGGIARIGEANRQLEAVINRLKGNSNKSSNI